MSIIVELDNPFPDAFSRSVAQAFSLDTGMLKMINSAVISMQVKRIYDPFLIEKYKTAEKMHYK